MILRAPFGTLSFLCLVLACSSINAQLRSSRSYASTSKFESSSKDKAQRATVVSILAKLVEESEHFRDPTLKIRAQARAADALWKTDEVLARQILVRAWKGAELIDAEETKAVSSAIASALKSKNTPLVVVPPAASLRSEILSLAARRDPHFAEFLLDKLNAAKDENSPQGEDGNLFDPTEPNFAVAKRLEIALELLKAGDTFGANSFAEPALKYATSQGIIFLCALRSKDVDRADRLFENLLTLAANDSRSDATTVSLLSTYALTPNVMVTATRRGRVSNEFGDPSDTYSLQPTLRSKFFVVAAAILLRPLSPRDQDHSSAGRGGTYFTISRLLPLFQRYSPHYVSALSSRLSELGLDVPEPLRNGQDGMLRLGISTEGTPATAVCEVLSGLESAQSSEIRDALYVKAIRAGLAESNPGVREFASRIDDPNLRAKARAFADLAAVRMALEKRDIDGSLTITNAGFLTPLHRVWALTTIGSLVESSDRGQAIELLDQAETEARRISVGETERVFALSCVANAFFQVDRSRSWNIVADAIKAANAVPGFTGDEGRLVAQLRTKGTVAMINVDEPTFKLLNLMELLGKDDLQLALTAIDSLTAEATRTYATLSVARSVLDRQKTRTVTIRRK